MIKEIPILFSTDMVLANLEGRKRLTRRTRDLKDINACPDNWELKPGWVDVGGVPHYQFVYKPDPIGSKMIKCPYGQLEDILWVRESCQCVGGDAEGVDVEGGVWLYKADGEKAQEHNNIWGCDGGSWRPSIHMPKEACRIWLRNAGVRVERLHDITEEDAKTEGVLPVYEANGKFYLPDDETVKLLGACGDYKTGFKAIWYKVNDEESWKSNPWVWVVEYDILSTTGRPANL